MPISKLCDKEGLRPGSQGRNALILQHGGEIFQGFRLLQEKLED
jgi:hypothetical protein